MAWQVDYSHSDIQFKVRHMMISSVRGRFEEFVAVIDFDPENMTSTAVEVTVPIKSINTREEKRDNHLKSADFFDAENYPNMIFKSTRVEQDDARHGRLIGDLTIRDVTKEITLEVEYAGTAKSPWGVTSAGFSATGKLDRKEFDLTWNTALETGGVLVGDDVEIAIELELVEEQEQEQE